MGRNTGRGKVAYSWISPGPAKAGPTLRGILVVVVFFLCVNEGIKIEYRQYLICERIDNIVYLDFMYNTNSYSISLDLLLKYV